MPNIVLSFYYKNKFVYELTIQFHFPLPWWQLNVNIIFLFLFFFLNLGASQNVYCASNFLTVEEIAVWAMSI